MQSGEERHGAGGVAGALGVGYARRIVNRYLLRTLAVMVGLTLGFICAGFVTWPSLLGPAQAETAPSSAEVAPASAETSAVGHEESGEAHVDAGEEAAAGLVPLDEAGRPATPGWYRCVVWGIVGLFAAALVVGIPLTRLNWGRS